VVFYGTIFPFSTHQVGQNEEARLLGNENVIDENCLRDWAFHEADNSGIRLIEEKGPPVEQGVAALPGSRPPKLTSPPVKTDRLAPVASGRTDPSARVIEHSSPIV